MSRRRTIDRTVVAQLGQPVLRAPAAAVSPARIPTAEFQALVAKLERILAAAGGVGLAAPQAFLPERVFLAAVLPPAEPDGDRGVECFVNPQLSELSSEREIRWEGCLSFIELLVRVPRSRSLRIDYLDRRGQPKALRLAGFPARVVQHEYDHLDGILTIDRAASPRDIIKATEADDWEGDDEADDEEEGSDDSDLEDGA